MSVTHRCPAPGCEASVINDRLACGPHWAKLPWSLRIRLQDAWRARQLGAPDGEAKHLALVAEAMKLWRTS